ncbi:MAG: presqualene diphosphate synthase HpnD [Acidobacteria bacterium]|nr:presqualene diphosphate synthase HpnD [Acidobacteriota bacterium]
MAADSALSRLLSAPNRLRKAIGSNFYYSFLFLPASKRKAITNVYSFARILDDIVDNDLTGRDPQAELQYWRDEVELCYLGQPSTAFGEELMMTIDEFDLPKQPLLDLIEGMEMDLQWSSYQTFSDLREYCYRAASAVGLICIEIFGYDSPRTREYAVNLGLALQLTNILRDLQEDAARGRVYIPLEDLERFGYSEQDLKANVYNAPFIDLMKYQYKRANYYFERAAAVLPEQDRAAMVAAEIMGGIYHELLEKIGDVQFDVFRNRVAVSKMQRLKIAVKIWWKTRFGKT